MLARSDIVDAARGLSWFKSGLFWRTFLLLGLLTTLSMASWIGMINAVQRGPHPLLTLAQRLPSCFAFRTPTDAEELQYPSVYLANDNDGYLFRLLGSRFEGDWSPALPGRNRQLLEQFRRSWERARPCTELRALGL